MVAKKIKVSCNAGCTLLPSAFGESLGRKLPETRLGEYDSLHSCRDSQSTKGESVQTRARIKRVLVKVVVMFVD